MVGEEHGLEDLDDESVDSGINRLECGVQSGHDVKHGESRIFQFFCVLRRVTG